MPTDDQPTRREFDGLQASHARLDREFDTFRDRVSEIYLTKELYNSNKILESTNSAFHYSRIDKLEGVVAWVVRSLVSLVILAPAAAALWAQLGR